MKFANNIDTRIANYLIRKLNGYLFLKERRKRKFENTIWMKRYRDSDFLLHSLNSDLKIRLYNDSILSRFIYEGFEADEIKFLNDFLMEGDSFVDIGSNIGLFSLYASRKVGPAGTVLAFEPARLTYNRLLENIQLNGIKNIRPYQLGLSDKDEILELNVSSDGHEAWNTFVQRSDEMYSLKEKVQVKSFDNFLKENDIESDKISLIKLDVEGFELNVLRGSAGLLASQNAPVFLVEFTDENAISAGNCCHELYKLLLQYDYSWFTYDVIKKKLIRDAMRINYPYVNLIAVKNAANNNRTSRFFS
jgi:FkbM family methyltransferase